VQTATSRAQSRPPVEEAQAVWSIGYETALEKERVQGALDGGDAEDIFAALFERPFQQLDRDRGAAADPKSGPRVLVITIDALDELPKRAKGSLVRLLSKKFLLGKSHSNWVEGGTVC
jgi:hypothetical protein